MQTNRALLLLLLLSSSLRAVGSLVVTVKDPQGALVAGATVNATLLTDHTPLAKFTDSQGRAVFDMAVMADFGGRSVTMGFSQNDKDDGTVKNALIEETINRP